MQFKHQIFFIFSTLLIVPVVIFAIIVYMYLVNGEKEDLLEGRQGMLTQLGNSIDLLVDDAAKSSLSILFNHQQLSLLRKYEASNSSVKKRTDENDIKYYLQSVVYRKQQIKGMTFISAKGHVFSSLHDSEYRDFIDVSLLPYMELAIAQAGKAILIYDEQPNYYTSQQQGYVSLVRAIRDPYNTKFLGIMKVDFNHTYIEQLVAPFQGGYYKVLNNTGEVLLANSEDSMEKNCNFEGHLNSNQCLQVVSKEKNVTLQYMLPDAYYDKQIRTISRWIVVYVLFILCLAVIITYFIVKKMLKPLNALKSYLGKYQRVGAVMNESEIEPYLYAYDGMIVEINMLVQNIYDATKKNLEMEYKVRQSQMDPHFLFNTLEMINMKALINKDLALSDMIVQLSKIFRYHIKKKDLDVTLADEIQFAKAYLSLMELRLGDRLRVRWDISYFINRAVPKYLIQPLLENAIIHGIRETGETLNLHIKIEENDNGIRIQVSDDGNGIESHRLKKIIEKIAQPSMIYDEEIGIALVNIQKLLHYGFNKNNTLYIESEPGDGTVVTIQIYGSET